MIFANIYGKIYNIKRKMIFLYGTRARRRKETLATPRIPRMERIFFFALRAEILKNLLENLWSLTAQKGEM